jgi:hypothetical protein
MSLMKLLSVSKSLAGGRNQPGRYKMVEQGLLPKFAPVGRPVSLAPKRKSDGPTVKKEQSTTPTAASNSLPGNLFQVADPVTEVVKAVAPTPRAAVCVNANAAPTNWFRLGNNPFVNRPAGRPKPLTPQGAYKNGAGTASSPHFVSSTAFYGDEPSPPLLARFLERTLLTPAQAELSLDAVKPVRNDLSDSDLQIVPAKPEIKPDALKPPRPHLLRPELTGFAWSRLTARFFNSERVRA